MSNTGNTIGDIGRKSIMQMARLSLLALAALAGPAAAQTLPYPYPREVGTGASVVLPINPARKQLIFINPNATAIVSVCPSISRVDSIPIPCTLHAPGAIPLLPYAVFTVAGYGPNPAIPQAWNAVSNTPNSSLTILEWE